MSKKNKTAGYVPPVSAADNQAVNDSPYPVMQGNNWITDRAWVCGLVGAITVFVCAFWFQKTNALDAGIILGGYRLTFDRTDTLLAALLIIASAMLLAEGIRLWLRNRGNFFCIDPNLQKGNYGAFLLDALKNYALNLLLLGAVILIYKTAGEYGFQHGNQYYKGWFRFLDILWAIYLYWGLPYVLLTRAVKHDPQSDRRDMAVLTYKVGLRLITAAPGLQDKRPLFNDYDKKSARALLVKMFFTPLMTVFFLDQFPHLVNNLGYFQHGIPSAIANNAYSHNQFNVDYFNIAIASIFSVDVALAWCGYVVSSRWVDNQTVSAEPTMLGWVVCLICYPPFQMFLGLYYAAPGEREMLQYDNQWLVTVFTSMMLLSYFVYMSATLWFGVRFSNLTNRGIIRTGPYAFIRHPAYASKNFAWWCVMFPAVIFNATHHSNGLTIAAMQTAGLILMTWVYYLRAITEERHLSADPAYQEYCKQVKYRFIPGLI